MSDRQVVIAGRLTAAQVTEVLQLVDAATEEDGVRPLDEHVMLHLRYGGETRASNLLLYSGGELAGYAHLDTTDPVQEPSAELAVAPARRGDGHGHALVRALLQHAPDGRLRLWAHGNHPVAGKLAASLGFKRIRSLWQMRRSLHAPLPQPELPPDVRVRTLVPGQDEQEWVALNARAFAGHPEQATWTVDDVRTREQEPWFDPEGFFLAERGGRLLGFHWTKVHSGQPATASDGGGTAGAGRPTGEVYIVGVDPAAQGLGLGRALTLVGLRHLQARGLSQAMLYVEEANTGAIRLYESLGFRHWDTDVVFRFAREATART